MKKVLLAILLVVEVVAAQDTLTYMQTVQAMDDLAAKVNHIRYTFVRSQTSFTDGVTDLQAVPTEFAKLITTLNARDTSDVNWKSLKAQFSKYVVEYVALRNKGTTAASSLSGIDFTK